MQEQANELARLKAHLDAAKDAAIAAHAAVAGVLGGGGGDLHDRNLGALPVAAKLQAPEIPTLGGGRGGAGRGAASGEAREQFTDEIDAARRAATQIEDTLNNELRLHQITWSQWAAQSVAALDKEKAAVELAAAQAVASTALSSEQKLGIARREADALAEIAKKEADDQAKATEEITKSWESLGSTIEGAFNSQLKGLLSGTESFSTAMKKTAEDLGLKFIETGEKIVVNWLSDQAAMRAGTTLGDLFTPLLTAARSAIASLAGVVGAGVAANQAFITGPGAVAEGFGAAAVVAGWAGGIGSADIGMWRVPGDMLTLIHHNELVMPAPEAGAFRSLLTGASRGGERGQGGRSSGGDLHVHVHAMDSQDVMRALSNNRHPLSKMIADHWNANPSVRPKY